MKIACPNTDRPLNIPDALAGKKFRCPACKEVHQAPALEQEPPEPEIEETVSQAEESTESPVFQNNQENFQDDDSDGSTGDDWDMPPPAPAHTEEPGRPFPRPGVGAAKAAAPARTRSATASRTRGKGGEEETTELPTRGRGRAKTTDKGKKKPWLLIGGVAAAVLAIGGYFINLQMHYADVRKKAAAYLAGAEDLHEKRDFKQAEEQTVFVAKLMKEEPSAFGGELAAQNKAAIEKYQKSLDNYDKASGLCQLKDFEKAVSLLEKIMAQDDVKPYKALVESIEELRENTIIGHAKTITKKAAELDEVVSALKSLAEIDEKYAPSLSSDAKTRLQAIQKDFLKAGQKQVKFLAERMFRQIPDYLGQGRIEDAFALPETFVSSLGELPEALAGNTPGEVKKLVVALEDGNISAPDGQLKLKDENLAALKQVFGLRNLLREADKKAGSGFADLDRTMIEFKELQDKAKALRMPSLAASGYINDQIGKKMKVFADFDQANDTARELIRGGNPAEGYARLIILRAAMASTDVNFDLANLKGGDTVSAEFELQGDRITVTIPKNDYRKFVYLQTGGYKFRAPWSFSIFKYLVNAASLGKQMATVAADKSVTQWDLHETPMGSLASGEKDGKLLCFFGGELLDGEKAANGDASDLAAFKAAASELHQSITKDPEIQEDLRAAFDAVLRSTYGKLDPRDHIDGDFIRGVVRGDYVERNIPNLSAKNKELLDKYRQALARLDAGKLVFSFTRKNGDKVTAIRNLAGELDQMDAGVGDFSVGSDDESSFSWRIEGKDETTFAMPLPHRDLYMLYLCTTYPGRHEVAPRDAEPIRVTMNHGVMGEVASYRTGMDKVQTDEKKWNQAMALDLKGISRESLGPGGWAMPPNVPIFGGDGKPQAIVTRNGVLRMPDFSGITDQAELKKKQDAFLDETAKVLNSAGDLGLFLVYFGQYCHDSPLPTNIELIGSAAASGDNHQTVYQLLDRKIGGRFVGDCDDWAEAFQVLSRRQGKISHVLSLPKHAACGYVDKISDTDYNFIILQTGPTMLYTGTTLDEVVTKAYSDFGEAGESHFSVAALPFLFRFANEQTRTGYQLSARIFVDREYAENMINVQSYWHYHYYSTAIDTMEKMIAGGDRDISNYSELAGLYRSVGLFNKAIDMCKKELEEIDRIKKDDLTVRLSAIMRIGQFHAKLDENDQAIQSVAAVLQAMAPYWKKFDDALAVFRSAPENDKKGKMDELNKVFGECMQYLPTRLEAAYTAVEAKRPEVAFQVLFKDLTSTNRLSPPVRNYLMLVFERLQKMIHAGHAFPQQVQQVQKIIVTVFVQAFGQYVFTKEDDFRQTLMNYANLARFAIALNPDQKAAIAQLIADGSFPDKDRDHTARTPVLPTEEDWKWFRVCPWTYSQVVSDLLDPDEKEKNDPETALKVIDAMLKAVEQGKKFGSMSMFEQNLLQARIIKAILTKDIEALKSAFADMRKQDFSEYYDSAATTFGQQAGRIPLADFPQWMDVFHEHFPGKQHYFKVAYRAADSKYYDHSLAAAKAAVKYFPQEKAMQREAEYMGKLLEEVKKLQKDKQPAAAQQQEETKPEEKRPAA
jgi:tetratricopeptide (TPR) repeat protein